MTYKDNLSEGSGALCLAYSDDGVNWRDDPRNPAMVGLRDTRHNIIYDPRSERWFLFTRPLVFAGAPGRSESPEHNFKRRVAVATGETPFDFGFPRVVMWPDESDAWDFDNMMVGRLGSHFLGFLSQMTEMPKQEFDLHLAFSRDGLHWQQLPGRQPLIGRGQEGEFDAGITSNVDNIVTVKDWSFLYYTGAVHGQGGRENRVGIGRAEMRRRRFIAQLGSEDGGFLLTREVVVAAPKLTVNITLASGYDIGQHALEPPAFGAEVLAREGGGTPKPVPGFTLADGTAAPTDLIDYEVTWKDKPDLQELVGRPVFIRFFLKNVGLYDLCFREAGQDGTSS